jgi:hypothetical protein
MSGEATGVLDDLLATLEHRLAASGDMAADAITRTIAEPPRCTGVVSLRDAPAVEAFRQALVDGLIRVDTANQLLRLIQDIVVHLA